MVPLEQPSRSEPGVSLSTDENKIFFDQDNGFITENCHIQRKTKTENNQALKSTKRVTMLVPLKFT